MSGTFPQVGGGGGNEQMPPNHVCQSKVASVRQSQGEMITTDGMSRISSLGDLLVPGNPLTILPTSSLSLLIIIQKGKKNPQANEQALCLTLWITVVSFILPLSPYFPAFFLTSESFSFSFCFVMSSFVIVVCFCGTRVELRASHMQGTI